MPADSIPTCRAANKDLDKEPLPMVILWKIGPASIFVVNFSNPSTTLLGPHLHSSG